MDADITVARSELILGGQKSGKSGRAEALARSWLEAASTHRAVLIATAQPWDAEMRERIARHQRDRLNRVPALLTVEEPTALAQAVQCHSSQETLVVVDCLTLWLTNLRMPAADGAQHSVRAEPVEAAPAPETGSGTTVREPPGVGQARSDAHIESAFIAPLLDAIGHAIGPLVLVGNEIGLGVIPMGAEVRAFVDALGRLNQQVAHRCARVTLMAAGLPLTLKDTAC